jgi:hypothetical protein
VPVLPTRGRALASRALPWSVRRARRFHRLYGRLPSLVDPQTFSEKVNWRILLDRRPLLAQTCDKLAMKEYARQVSPTALHVPELYWSGTDVTELADVDLAPHWVLKPNNASGLVVFGSGLPDVDELAATTRGWEDMRYWRRSAEWAYRQARRGLLVEELVGIPGLACPDLKVLVFDGVPRIVAVHSGRGLHHCIRFYDTHWASLSWRCGHDQGPDVPPPRRLSEMLEASSALAEGFDMLRVDFYEHAGVLWIGELTPYPGAGLSRLDPGFDELLGSWWTLPDLDPPPPLLRAARAVGRLTGRSHRRDQLREAARPDP